VTIKDLIFGEKKTIEKDGWPFEENNGVAI
jgi:hypothetical protein